MMVNVRLILIVGNHLQMTTFGLAKVTLKKFPVDDFLNEKLWDGRTFWEAEQEIEWVDA